MVNLNQLCKTMIEKGASELIITTGAPPQLRIDGFLCPLKSPPVTAEDSEELCTFFMDEDQRSRLQRDRFADFTFGIRGLSRFRARVFIQREAVAGVFSALPFRILSLMELGLPAELGDLCCRPNGGLLLISCTPGAYFDSQISAGLIDKINTDRHLHIVTVEKSVSLLHPHKNSIVNQLEFNRAEAKDVLLKRIRDLSPDCLLIHDLPDPAILKIGLDLSLAGCMVIVSLPASSAVNSILRVLGCFREREQAVIRPMIAASLLGVFAFTHFPKASGHGRVLACDAIIPELGDRMKIREGLIADLSTRGEGRFAQGVADLYLKRMITLDDALGGLGNEHRASFLNLIGWDEEATARMRERAERRQRIRRGMEKVGAFFSLPGRLVYRLLNREWLSPPARKAIVRINLLPPRRNTALADPIENALMWLTDPLGDGENRTADPQEARK